MKECIVTIFASDKQEVVNFIQEKLEFENISCFFTADFTEGHSYGKIKIKVKGDQTEKAVKVLLDIHSKYDLNQIKLDESLTDQKRILVPVDLCQYTLNAAVFANSLAKKINAEIKFLLIYQDPSDSGTSKMTTSWQNHANLASEQSLKAAQKELVMITEKLEEMIPEKDRKAVKHHFVLHRGEIIDVINQVSARYKPNLLILGAREKHDKKNAYLGNKTTTVIENTHVPVLTIPRTFSYIEDELNVLYATDFYDSDNSSLERLIEILGPFKTNIHCIHINKDETPVNTQKIDELNRMLEKNYSDKKIHCELIENKDMLKGLEKFIKQKDIDVLSFSSPRRNIMYKIFNTNKLKKMVAAGQVPMLIFRV